MTEIQEQVVKVALKKLFTQKHFSICEIDNCLKVAGIIPDKTNLQTMRTLHCIDYSEMPETVRQWLITTVSEMFEFGEGFDLSWLDDKPKQQLLTIVAEVVENEEKAEPKKLSFGQKLLRLGS